MEQTAQTEQQLEEIEVNIAEARLAVQDRDDLLSLMQDKRFKRLIEERYFSEEPRRLVMLKAAGLRDEQLDRVDRLMFGVSALDQFFRQIIANGNQMEQAIQDDQQTREELLTEQQKAN